MLWLGRPSLGDLDERHLESIFRRVPVDEISKRGGPMRSERDKMLAGELYDPMDPPARHGS